jgi:hypothetical protein
MTVSEQLRSSILSGIHSDLLKIGKCETCKVAYVWKKESSKPTCSCGKELARTTFLSKLRLKVV